MIRSTAGSKFQIFTNKRFVFFGLCLFALLSGCGTPGNNASPVPNYQFSGVLKPGVFSIQRIQLEFAQGLSNITVNKGQKITPKAQIKFTGTGILSATWRVDGRIVEQVNISLSHGSLLTLSPKKTTQLPTFIMGHHSLQLQVNRPTVNFKQPKLSFFVVHKP